MKAKDLLLSVGIMAISLQANAASVITPANPTSDAKEHAKKEKCYGIVKAGKNDCAAADGSHSCAGYAKSDASGKEWVLLAEGTCERIMGGLLKPDFDKKGNS